MKQTPVIFIFFSFLLHSCSTTYKPNPARTAATRAAITPDDSLVRKERSGIEFYAEGDDPVHWTLELDLEKGFSFKPADERLLIAPPAASTRQSNPGADSYSTTTDLGPLKIVINDASCISSGNEKKTSRNVVVTLNNKRYSGCGSNLYNYLLNDIWVLESIHNKGLNITDYKKQAPSLEFNLSENKLYGHDGCNNINSTFWVQGSHISFSTFGSSKKSCPGNEAATVFSTMLSGQVVDYYIKNGKLVMSLSDDSKIVFRKVD